MSIEMNLLSYGLGSADADYSAKRGFAVKPSATGVVLAGAGEAAIGPLLNAPESGAMANVGAIGVFPVYYGDTVAVGDALMSNASGHYVPVTGTNKIIGMALIPGVVGDYGYALVPGTSAGVSTILTANITDNQVTPAKLADALDPSTTETITALGASAISIVTQQTIIDSTLGAQALTMADGAEGQIKYVLMTVDNGDSVITPANLGNGTTITFDDANDFAVMRFMGTNWWCLDHTATLA